MTDKPSFLILTGSEATAWARDPSNGARWTRLADRCPWATAFFSPTFFDIWSRHYGQAWTSLIVLSERSDGELLGLMPLAQCNDIVTGVGAHQAEYHGWISDADQALPFLAGAVGALRGAYPRCDIRLQYLPAEVPQDALAAFCAQEPRAIAERHERHHMRLDAGAISDVLRKKGNKSKLNRLRRQGSVELKRLDADLFELHLDDISALCDFRQGAVNDSCPFTDDVHKRPFHADLVRDFASSMHVTGLFLDGELISTIIFVLSRRDAHIAILAHSPTHASNSPSKLHLYQAALMLLADGFARIDMTPGGDDWKARFGTESDFVTRLTIRRSAAHAALTKAQTVALGVAKSAAAFVGLTPVALRRLLGRDDAVPPSRPRSFAFLQLDPKAATAPVEIATSPNDLAILLRHGPQLTGRQRQPFLADAVARMESGEICYTLARESALLGLGWASVAPPQGPDDRHLSVRFSGFHAAPGREAQPIYRAIVARALRDAAPVPTLATIVAEYDQDDPLIGEALGPLVAAAQS